MKKVTIIILFLFVNNVFGTKPPRKEYLLTINTPYGAMKAILYNSTPKHKQNFLKLVNEKFYDSLLFHRVMQGFMIQGGDPNSKNAGKGVALGTGSNGYTVPAEINANLFHKKGALAAAHTGNPEKASSGCQFYIVQGKTWTDADLEKQIKRSGRQADSWQKETYKTVGGSPHLDGNYTVFGQVISGLAVIDSVAKQKTAPNNRPIDNITMTIKAEQWRSKKIYKKFGYKVEL